MVKGQNYKHLKLQQISLSLKPGIVQGYPLNKSLVLGGWSVVFANILSKSKETSDYQGHRCAAVLEAGTMTDKINMIQTQMT